jgi:biopolymer transport protein TolR
MHAHGGGTSGPITRINVTPIIDVALVLVIILLVTAPMMSNSDLPVNLPAAATRGAEDERNVSITLGADGRTAVDDQVVDGAVLRDAVAAKLARPGDAGMLVVVRADAAAPYARVKGALDAARAAGARRLAIATRQRVEAER